jgi:asparagine synthase (glutamine-hydrolysing)
MCGICGVVSLTGAPINRARIAQMNDTLVHRGPDEDGYYLGQGVGLAMRRLSIIDLDGGSQPISNEDGAVHVVQNGEIYNYRELRTRLDALGHRFETESDTEVLVHLYEEHGPGFVEHLRGMFAVALWDERSSQLVLARDPFGIKPLHYRLTATELAFASELKALPGGDVDLDALEAFLAYNVIPGPLTIYRDTRKLQPGHVAIWSAAEGLRLQRFARPGATTSIAERDAPTAELAEELRARLRDSVRAHLVADVPVGVLLSGGVDSSTLCALAAEESSERVRTFSIGFEEQSFNELDTARLVAERYGTEHHELVVKPDAATLLPAFTAIFDEPFADSAALPTYLVSQLASQHVKVVLSGEGGDELFGGYYTYVADLLAPRLAPARALLRPLAEALPSSSKRVSFDYKAKRFAAGLGLPALERHHAWKEIFAPDARAELLGRARNGAEPVADPVKLLRARYAETEGCDELARLQDVDVGILMVDDLLTRTDRTSMSHSLEVRVPFLDPVVSSFAFALPRAQKVRRFDKKRLLREAVSPLVPQEIVNGTKRGFSIPAARWLRGELEPFAREVLSPETLKRHGYLEPAAATSVLDTHVAGTADLSRQLWGLISFTLWAETRASAPAGTAAAPVA